MKYKQSLFVVTLAMLASMQGCWAAASYKLWINNNKHDCAIFLAAVKASRLDQMSDFQLCNAMDLPVSSILKSKYIRDVKWRRYPSKSHQEKVALAKKITDSRYPKDHLKLATLAERKSFHDGEKEIISSFSNLDIKTKISAEWAELYLKYGAYYALRMHQEKCGANYKKHRGLMPAIWGVFLSGDHSVGMNAYPFTPSGNLFYLDHRLLVLDLSDRWEPHFAGDNKKNELTVTAMSMDNVLGTITKKPIFATQLVCTVIIHK